MKKTTLIIFLLFSLKSFAGFYSANYWEVETPHGNHIKCYNNGKKNLSMRNGVYIICMNEWYFYDDCVIGRMDTTNKCHTYTYFVAQEMFNIVDTFYTEKDWKTFIKLHDLEPFIWKRTYTSDWRKFPGFEFFFILIIFGIPIYVINRILKTAFNMDELKKPRRIITLIIIGLFVLRYLLDIFPGSI